MLLQEVKRAIGTAWVDADRVGLMVTATPAACVAVRAR